MSERYTVYVCDEPDGGECDSGTHPNICRHRCGALREFHENGGPGPKLREVETVPSSLLSSLEEELRQRAETLNAKAAALWPNGEGFGQRALAFHAAADLIHSALEGEG